MTIYRYSDAEHTATRVLPQRTLPEALRVHPKGFRVLSKRSPIERSFGSYFRLPPPQTKQHAAQIQRVQRMIKLRGRGAEGKRVPLDGFALLEACKVEDPEEAVEVVLHSHRFGGVVSEDLAFFSNLEFFDAGENQIALQDLLPLKRLEEVHLHCNQLRQVDLSEGFPHLSTLNLSFNNFADASVLESLAVLPSLHRLDMTGNRLTCLPSGEVMKQFSQLVQLALENNNLEGDGIFRSLSCVPGLQEVNLNGNRLTNVPVLETELPQEGEEGGGAAVPAFLSLQVIGLANNRFNFFEDLFALSKIVHLRRAVLWGNPIQHRRGDVEILVHELSTANIVAFLEGPLPPKKGLSDFYGANAKNMVKVGQFKRQPLRKPRNCRKSLEKENEGEEERAEDVVHKPEEEEEDYDPTFFMTELTEKSTDRDASSRRQSLSAHKSISPAPPAASVVGGLGDADDAWFQVGHATEQPRVNQALESFDELLNAPTPSDLGDKKSLASSQPLSCNAALRELKQALRHPITTPVSTHLVSRRRKRKGQYTNIYSGSQARLSTGKPSANLPPLP